MPTLHRYFQLLLLALAFGPLAHADDGAADQVRTWFATQYAPLWEDLDQLDPEAIKDFWVDAFRDHPIDADSTIWENTTEQWQRTIDRYKAEGLQGSTVIETKVEKISNRAVLISTKWSDHGSEGKIEEPYCGTFIAAKFQEDWKFTNYFTVECSAE